MHIQGSVEIAKHNDAHQLQWSAMNSYMSVLNVVKSNPSAT